MRVFVDEIAGVRTRWYQAGDPSLPPALVVHGGGAGADTWIRNLEAMGQHRFVVAPDLLGHGFTDLPDGVTAEVPQIAQAERLWAIADHFGWERITLVGHSFGALIVALMAVDRPERVESLVLVASSSVFHPPTGHTGVVEGARANQLPALNDPTIDRLRARNVGSNFDDSDPFEEILAIQMTIMALPGRLEAYDWTTRGLAGSVDLDAGRVYHRLEDLALPTLVLSGVEDTRCRIEAVREGVARMPAAELVELDRCGHKPHSEHAATFNQVVGEFLARTTSDVEA